MTAARRPHDRKRDGGDRPLQQDEQCACHSGDDERSRKRPIHVPSIACAGCLRGEACRRHAQGAEAPEQEIEDHRSERDRAQQMGLAEPSDDGCVDEAEQRRRDVGQGHGECQHQHAPMIDLDGAWCSEGVHESAQRRPNRRVINQIGMTMMAP